MPAAITHCLQCQRVLEQVKKEIPSFAVLREPFFWGAQGPDFFACHRFLPGGRGKAFRSTENVFMRIPPPPRFPPCGSM